MGNSVSVTVQVIATDTGTVFTAAKTRFLQDDSIKQLLLKSPVAENNDADKPKPVPQATDKWTQKLGDMLVIFDKIQGADAECRIDFRLRNLSTKKSIGVAMYHEVCFVPPCNLLTKLIAGDGTETV